LALQRILILGIVSVFLFFACFCGWVYLQATKTIALPQPIEIALERGMGAKQFARKLQEKIPDVNKWGAYLQMRFLQKFEKFQAGQYQFDGTTSLGQIFADMRSGKVHNEVLFSFTIPEGFTIQKIAARLAAKGLGTQRDFLRIMHSPAFLQKMNITGAKTLEGFMYPATYSFYKPNTPEQIITKMVDTFWRNLPPDYLTRLKQKNMSLVDAVNIASMIELETSKDGERPLVAEVILARLNKKEPIGIDAALIYGIKGYDGNIRTRDLKDRSNPYNNRIYKGLPPTPIGSPSKASLEAVLNPTNYGNYFYVLADPETGSHHFSKTLAEHNLYVRKLIELQRRR
jgi:UPF0755 protein